MVNRCVLPVLLCLCATLARSQPYTISTVAGANRLLDGGKATAAPLRGPAAIAVDAAGNYFIADRDDHRVRKVDTNGIISTYAGTGVSGYSGDRGKASAAQLSSPTGLAIDSKGNLYIADRDNFVIRRVSPDGTINTVVGNGTPGFSGDNGSALFAQIQPVSIAIDSKDNLLIGDAGNFRVRKVDTKGIISTIAGTGQEGNSGDKGLAVDAQIEAPIAIAADPAGNVYIATLFWVRKIDSATGKITTIAGSGVSGFISDGLLATQALMVPSGLLVSNDGGLYVSDLNRSQVRRVDLTTDLILTVAGNGSGGFSGDGGPPTQAEMNFPFGLALLPGNQLLIADLGNGRVRKVAGGSISTVVGTDIHDGGPATSAFLNLPIGIAIDSLNRIVVADTGNAEARQFTQGGNIGAFGQLAFASMPAGVAVDQANAFYVTDDEPRVVKIAPDGVTTIVAGDGSDGYDGDTKQATSAKISKPTGVAVDSAGNVYITDYTHNRIRKITHDGIIDTIAGTGSPIYSGDKGPATAAGLDPYDIAVDSGSNLYVADSFNHRIRKIDSKGIITTVAGTGAPGYSGDGGLATAATLRGPTGVAVDKAGNLYIADNGNAVVRRVTAGGLITTIAGNGAAYPSSGDGGPAISAQLDPYRVAVDASSNVYVTDRMNDRVRKLVPKGGVPVTLSIVSGNQQSAGLGAALSAPLVVKIADRNGAGLAGVIVTFTATPAGAATFNPSPAITLNDGTASTRVTLGSIAGAVTVTVSADGVSPATFTLTAISNTAPVISAGGITSAGLSTPRVTAVAVNSIVSIFGTQFAPPGPLRQVSPSDLVDGKIPTNLAGVCVLFGTQRAPILVVVSTQLNVQVPQVPPGTVSVQVITKCDTPQAETSNPLSIQVQPAAPEFFYFAHNADGHNPIAAINAVTGAYIGGPALASLGSFVPAHPGDILTLFATGFGATDPAVDPGVIPSKSATVTAPVSVTFGGVALAPSDILYAGVSGNAGVNQLSIRVPDAVPDGDQQLVVTIAGVGSSAGGFITVSR